MPTALADQMLTHLREVDAQRSLRQQRPGLGEQVQALKRYQQRRFANTYADLLQSPRYQQAAQFFLKELYGPGDYSRRDAQFARVVPTLTRLFPDAVIATVAQLAQLHAISEHLDTRMAELLEGKPIKAKTYLAAWQACQEPEQRYLQIELTIAVGDSLEKLTRKPLLRQALRLMRGPASGAGMSELQNFLESGFDTFRAMQGAAEFLSIVRERESALAAALFAAASDCPAGDDALGKLP